MKSFHGLQNIAGIPGELARGERELGFVSRSVCFPSAVGTPDVEVPVGRGPVQADLLERCIDEYDVFNFHFGYSFLGQSLRDLPVLKARGKRISMHFHGCDIRNSKIVLERHPISACGACWPMACNANRTHARAEAQKYADMVFVTTPDLLEFVDGAHLLAQAVDVEAIDRIRMTATAHAPPTGRPVRIAHAPSASKLKGSDFLIAAVEDLKAAGYAIELVMLTGLPHADVLRAIASADIAVDQLLIGSYGVMAVEAMLLGKPTICYIREDIAHHYGPELPIISASPVDLRSKLAKLIDDRDQWDFLGSRSRAYALRVHDSRIVARRLREYYSH